MSDVNKEIALYPMSGDKVRFVSTAKLPIGGFETELHPIQDLHGYEYPWPAGGGKNLAPPVVGGQAFGVTCSVNSDGSVNLNGTATGNARFVSEEFTLKAGTYKSNGVPQGGINNYVFYLDGVSGSANIGGEITITVPSDVVTKSVVQVYNGGTANNITMYPMIRLSSVTDGTFAPYENICPITGRDSVTVYVSPEPTVVDGTEEHEIEFGQTVYEGTLTVNEDGSGQIVSTMANADLGTLTWSSAPTDVTGKNRFYANVPGIKVGTNQNVELICSEYHKIASTYVYGLVGISTHGTVARVLIADYTKAEMTPTEFKTAMSGVQLVYELEEPITINLTVEQIETLIGFNYVWNNVGTTNIVFQYYTGGEGMAITFLDCWTYPKAKLDEMFKAVNDRLEALEEASDEASADSNAKTTLLETKEEATEPVAEVEREGDE